MQGLLEKAHEPLNAPAKQSKRPRTPPPKADAEDALGLSRMEFEQRIMAETPVHANSNPFSVGAQAGFRQTWMRAAAHVASNRQKFNATPIQPALLAKLDAFGLGRVPPGERGSKQQLNVKTRDDYLNASHKEAEQFFRSRRLNFLGAATTPASFLPASDKPVFEVAFAGRSNVGKSTLINLLTKSSPARSRNKPGVTQSINFYRVTDQARVVDFPGYGFAFANEAKQSLWQDAIRAYLQDRTELELVYLVLDARHGIKQNDRDFMDYLDRNCHARYQIILNKCDLVPRVELARRIHHTLMEVENRGQCVPEIIPLGMQHLNLKSLVLLQQSLVQRLRLAHISKSKPGSKTKTKTEA